MARGAMSASVMRPSSLTPGSTHRAAARPPRGQREAGLPCTQACDLCDYTLAADSGPLLMPFSETPDSGPFTEQRLIIVLRCKSHKRLLSLTECTCVTHIYDMEPTRCSLLNLNIPRFVPVAFIFGGTVSFCP